MRQINQTDINLFKFKTKEENKYEAMVELVLDTHEGYSRKKGLQSEQQIRLFLTIGDIDLVIQQLTTAKGVMLKDEISEEEIV